MDILFEIFKLLIWKINLWLLLNRTLFDCVNRARIKTTKQTTNAYKNE